MCNTHEWKYKCGCLAPKYSSPLITRCKQHNKRESCITTSRFSYLDISCGERCTWNEAEDETYMNNISLLYGAKFDGMTSAEDKFFGRTRSPVGMRSSSPIWKARIRQQREHVVWKREDWGTGEVRDVENGSKIEEEQGVDVEDDGEGQVFESRSIGMLRRKK